MKIKLSSHFRIHQPSCFSSDRKGVNQAKAFVSKVQAPLPPPPTFPHNNIPLDNFRPGKLRSLIAPTGKNNAIKCICQKIETKEGLIRLFSQ